MAHVNFPQGERNDMGKIQERLRAAVGRPEAISFDGALLRRLKQPCVYAWLRGENILYIGKGSIGAARALRADHQWLQCDAIEEADVLLVFDCESGESELALETRLKRQFKPRFNDKTAPPPTYQPARRRPCKANAI